MEFVKQNHKKSRERERKREREVLVKDKVCVRNHTVCQKNSGTQRKIKKKFEKCFDF